MSFKLLAVGLSESQISMSELPHFQPNVHLNVFNINCAIRVDVAHVQFYDVAKGLG